MEHFEVAVDGSGVPIVPQDDATLQVVLEGPTGEIGAADKGDAALHDDHLGVQGGTGRAVVGGPGPAGRIQVGDGPGPAA
jgi:hypothetical protein